MKTVYLIPYWSESPDQNISKRDSLKNGWYTLLQRTVVTAKQVKREFHSTPESASTFLNERYDSIEEWWKMPKTQLAVDKFKSHVFVNSDNFVKPWTDELLAVRREALHGN